MIKKGVFEHPEMTYPWFAPQMQTHGDGKVQDMCGEDVSFCLDAKMTGIVTWCDPCLLVFVWVTKNSGDLIYFY